jgi:hypothetical protein
MAEHPLVLIKETDMPMTKEEQDKILSMIENMSEAMVKMQRVIGDIVHSNVELREEVKAAGKHIILLEGRVSEIEEEMGKE